MNGLNPEGPENKGTHLCWNVVITVNSLIWINWSGVIQINEAKKAVRDKTKQMNGKFNNMGNANENK
jgi:hypothetical protein